VAVCVQHACRAADARLQNPTRNIAHRRELSCVLILPPAVRQTTSIYLVHRKKEFDSRDSAIRDAVSRRATCDMRHVTCDVPRRRGWLAPRLRGRGNMERLPARQRPAVTRRRQRVRRISLVFIYFTRLQRIARREPSVVMLALPVRCAAPPGEHITRPLPCPANT
jgi:hypothetical protein